MTDLKHTTLRLPESILRKAKVEAAKADITLQTLLFRGLTLALDELKNKGRVTA